MSATRQASVRAFNGLVTQGWNRAAGLYNTSILQRLAYRPPQDEIIAQLAVSGAKRIADVGCGTGILASRIAADLTPEAIYGCDASAGMLKQARFRSDRVQWRNRQAEDLGFPDDAVDAVVSTHAFHFFDHQAALAEFHRILAPGGLLAIVLNNPTSRFARVLQPAPIQGLAYFPPPNEMRTLIEAAGFTVTEQRPVQRHPIPPALVPDVLTVARRD
ncbi:class I SAM-dependent methyltransferase [Nocardia sp. GCM10030253]|uniref:class I SAM-dependent methyltransferase n=1 Tax=Nocardia sp. GCM10030253 TaxID=3273404 RepID=UPI003641F9F5